MPRTKRKLSKRPRSSRTFLNKTVKPLLVELLKYRNEFREQLKSIYDEHHGCRLTGKAAKENKVKDGTLCDTCEEIISDRMACNRMACVRSNVK